MQAFVVLTARCEHGSPLIDTPLVFWDRQAAYRHYTDGGGDPIPQSHKTEPLHTKTPRGGVATLSVVDIPDRKRYDRDFVLELVRQIQEGEISQSEASRLYGPSQSRISEWVREFSSQLPKRRRTRS